MTLTIPDAILQHAGLTESDALIEFACRLYDAEKLPLSLAARLATLSRAEMEDELGRRGIAVCRITQEYWAQEQYAIQCLSNLGI